MDLSEHNRVDLYSHHGHYRACFKDIPSNETHISNRDYDYGGLMKMGNGGLYSDSRPNCLPSNSNICLVPRCYCGIKQRNIVACVLLEMESQQLCGTRQG